MDVRKLGALMSVSTTLILALAPACGSESPSGTDAAGTESGTGGGTSTGGLATGGGGSGTGGAGPTTGGMGPSTGGMGPSTGGTGPSTGGMGPSTGGMGPGTGGVATGGTGPSTGGSGAVPSTGGSGAVPSTGGTYGLPSTFTIDVELSTAIPTVGIVTWSLDAPIDSATIDFGRDQSNFEFQAPADLEADNHRTLLLGMKPNTTYYVRATTNAGDQTYVSEVASIETGYLDNGLPVQTVTDSDAGALYAGGGFTSLCTGYTMMGGPGTGTGVAVIFDRDGQNVWAYDLSETTLSTCTRARMSLDGKYMWVGNFGNTTTDGALMRIPMDGLGTPDQYDHPGRSHDFAILPNEHVAYFARDDGGAGMGPESIYELDPATGQSTLLYSELTDFGELFDAQGGHTNQINYVPELSALSFSMYFINTIALISYPEGQLLASFGGDKSTFSTMNWNAQHGHDVYADHISVFNNNGENGGASVLRFQFDLEAQTATEQPSYSSGLSSPAFGDVKELPNGNYFVTYSTSAVMQEIGPSLNLLREVETTESIGYAEHRGSLYGQPPPYAP